MKTLVTLLLAALTFLPAQVALTESLSFESTVNQTGLLELYTSEGCSSCPPADQWLSQLKHHPDLWSGFIPIALHVDYWDYIGWEDRFASNAYADRQRRYAKQQSLRAVYTPGFVYNGREWRSWHAGGRGSFPNGNAPGVLRLELRGDEAHIHFLPTQYSEDTLEVNVVLLGFGLESRVKAGENRGKTLPHDFVVLAKKQQRASRKHDSYSTKVTLPSPRAAAPRYGIAAWVNSPDRLAPIQAVGGQIPAEPIQN